jgi:hypothetical protein
MKQLSLVIVLILSAILMFGCASEKEPPASEPSATPSATVQTTSPEPDVPVFDIKTRVCVMKYPLKWKDLVTVEVADDSVCFSYGDIKLFDLLFDSDEGYLLGTYDGTQIKIISYDFDKDSLSEDEYFNCCAMQEDVNVILQYWLSDKNFVIAR